MKIGIDVSQIAQEGTGVNEYVRKLVDSLFTIDSKNEYVLFFSSLRRRNSIRQLSDSIQNSNAKVQIKTFTFPPTLLDFLWNKLHVIPIESLIGDVDVFISSDWTQPPVKKAKKATILYDLIVYKHPKETDKKIIETQKRRLKWVRQECDVIFCISEATKQDAMQILAIDEGRLKVTYPGVIS